MNERHPFIISIDDEYSLKMDARLESASFLDAEGLESLVEEYKKDPKLFFELLNPTKPIIIILDEHLPWDEFEGRSIYEGLGRFIIEHSSKPESIFIIGDSSDWAQEYFPRPNRVGKDIYTYARQPEKLLERYQPFSVKDIFNAHEFKGRAGITSYSDGGTRAYQVLKDLHQTLKQESPELPTSSSPAET